MEWSAFANEKQGTSTVLSQLQVFVDQLVASGTPREEAEKMVSPTRSLRPPKISSMAMEYLEVFHQLDQRRDYTVIVGAEEAKMVFKPISYQEIESYGRLMDTEFDSSDIRILNELEQQRLKALNQ